MPAAGGRWAPRRARAQAQPATDPTGWAQAASQPQPAMQAVSLKFRGLSKSNLCKDAPRQHAATASASCGGTAPTAQHHARPAGRGWPSSSCTRWCCSDCAKVGLSMVRRKCLVCCCGTLPAGRRRQERQRAGGERHLKGWAKAFRSPSRMPDSLIAVMWVFASPAGCAGPLTGSAGQNAERSCRFSCGVGSQ